VSSSSRLTPRLRTRQDGSTGIPRGVSLLLRNINHLQYLQCALSWRSDYVHGVGGSVTTLEIACICVQTGPGFVDKGSDHLQLIKCYLSAPPERESAAGRKFLPPPIQQARSACVSSGRFFHLFLLLWGRPNILNRNNKLGYCCQKKPRDAFKGQPRSPSMVPFDMLGIVSY